MRRKLGETLCSLLVTMSMILGLIPGISLTAYAAPTEELLTTITATGTEQASYSTANVATVSFSNLPDYGSIYTAAWGWWGYGWTATVNAAEGYTITRCVFYDDANRTATDSEAPFVVETEEDDKTPKVNGTPILAYTSKGIKKIEVYGYVTPAASYEVTYSVVNGTWSDGTTADKTETVASGASPASVPTGMIPSSGYTGGSWDTDPSTATITGNTTFTYTFTAIPTYTVTYRVVNGTWAGGATADKTETVASGASPASVPTGMIPSSGYTGGAWDTDPSGATITGDTTFTYSFEEEPAPQVNYVVTYSVVNGTWADGTTADKTETVARGESPASVPTGMIADSGYTGGAWDTDPSGATITGDTTFTYTFEAEKPEPPTPEPEPPTPAPSEEPVITPEQLREMTIMNFVERLYIVALNRTYDVAGRDCWMGQINDNVASGSDVARDFLNSEEFIARGLDDEAFITVLYRVLCDREPDPQGFTNWTNALSNGAARSEVISGFLGSEEWASLCARYRVNV